MLVAETLHMAYPALQGFEAALDHRLALRNAEPELWVDAASHLLCGHVGNRNYAHWWVDVVPALMVPPFHDAFDGTTLIWPTTRTAWQAQTLELLPETKGRSLFIGEHSRVGCHELRIVPKVTNSDYEPHPFRHSIIDALKKRVRHDSSGGRRLYISRRDAGARRLVNEDDVSALLERHGFETIVLTGQPVAEQIALFASASHVVGAHGAGLGNVIFCPNNAALCELQMSSSINWSIRRLAAVFGLRYGCILGKANDDTAPVYLRDWWIALDQLKRVLDDRSFMDAPSEC